MKTGPVAFVALSMLVASAVASSKYNAVCVFDKLKCGGSIQLREYTPTTNGVCNSGGCNPVPAYEGFTFSSLPTCTDDHVKDTKSHLSGSYVIVEFYDADGCAGDFSKAVAVVANGECFPASSGEMSYRVSSSGGNATWLQFTGPNCTASSTMSTTSFNLSSADGATCLTGNIKAIASIEGAATPSPSGGATARTNVLIATAIAAVSTVHSVWTS